MSSSAARPDTARHIAPESGLRRRYTSETDANAMETPRRGGQADQDDDELDADSRGPDVCSRTPERPPAASDFGRRSHALPWASVSGCGRASPLSGLARAPRFVRACQCPHASEMAATQGL